MTIKTGPKVLKGSEEAKKLACLIIEVFSGLQSPTSACEALDTSISRYYILETRALQGMIDALEPRNKGPQVTAEKENKKLKKEIKRLEKELQRSQTLVRAMHRSMGVKQLDKCKSQVKGRKVLKKKRKNLVRGKRIVGELRKGKSDIKNKVKA